VDGIANGLNLGYVGVGSDNSRGVFDNISVQVLPPQSTYSGTEDFEDGVANGFTGAGTWAVSAAATRGRRARAPRSAR
jgi:hypothetical protein